VELSQFFGDTLNTNKGEASETTQPRQPQDEKHKSINTARLDAMIKERA
jgi:hypothetical protein